jgi:hypothetical protein
MTDQESVLNQINRYKMEIISFDKLLLKTAFCCMASDGHIDDREITQIKSMCEKSPLFKDFNFQEEINLLIDNINFDSKVFMSKYLDLLHNANLTEDEEITLIDFAIKTIKADEVIEYSEIKFFKNIRHRIRLTDEVIVKLHPDFEPYLDEDIRTDNFLDKISKQYLEYTVLPQFKEVIIDYIDNDKPTNAQ